MSSHVSQAAMAATIVAALLSLGGCNQPLADLGPISAELGGGPVGFEPLTDGDEIFIVKDHQGTYIFFAGVRATGVAPGDPDDPTSADNPLTQFRAFRGDERIDVQPREVLGLRPVAGTASYELVARVLLLVIEDDAELEGASVRLEVDIEDADGRRASDQRSLIAVPHPDNI